MAIIRRRSQPGSAQQPASQPQSRSAPLLPGWLPLAVAVTGFGLLLSPEDVTWTVRVLGAVLLAAGSFWLGQDRQHDPADRYRISSLERQLIRLGVLDRELAARRDLAQTGRHQRSHEDAPAPEHGAALRDDPGRQRDPRRAPAPQPRSLDDPIPGVDT